MRVKLAGINTVRKRLADGSVRLYYYHRATGKPLRGEPGTDVFLKSFAEAAKSAPAKGDPTLSDLIRGFESSPDYAKWSDDTKSVAKWIFAKIDREFGDMTVAAIEEEDESGRSPARKAFLRWHSRMAANHPRGADNTLGHLQRVLSWAKYADECGRNPLATFRRAYQNDRSDMIWLPEHIERFTEHASPEIFGLMMLALHTGQRQGDIIRMPWSAYDGRALTIRQGKSKQRVYIPCTTALKEFLDERQKTKNGPLILTTPTGIAWKRSNLGDQWAATAEDAEIEELHFHDLRGTAVTMLAEAGCTTPEIAAITGHKMKTVDAILEKYLARTKTLAINAIAKLEAFRKRSE